MRSVLVWLNCSRCQIFVTCTVRINIMYMRAKYDAGSSSHKMSYCAKSQFLKYFSLVLC
jgi:hypothetical protein